MERLAMNNLIEWNQSKFRKPLVVYGARQTGKTYLIRNLFAETYYTGKYLYIDLKVEKTIRSFLETTVNASEIITYLEYYFSMTIDSSTLIIFDEVQECLSVLTALKYFCQDHREIPVIVSGSMVRIKIKREEKNAHKASKSKNFFPVGKIDQLTIHPMTFDEFLMNKNQKLYEAIKDSYIEKKVLPTYMHEMAMNHLYEFMLIGGMPEALDIYIQQKNGIQSRQTLQVLYDNYLNDMELYQASSESIIRCRSIYKNLYQQLSKESKNFSASLIDKSLRIRDFRNPIDWLIEAGIASRSFQVKEKVTYPLCQESDSAFRLYMNDIGFLTLQSRINMATFIDPNARNTLSGVFFENYVANEFIAKNLPLFYWKGKNNSEFEFLVESENTIVPIDVKKGKGSLNSLSNYQAHNSLKIAIKISSNNYEFDPSRRILTIPLYQCFALAKEIAEEQFTSDIFK